MVTHQLNRNIILTYINGCLTWGRFHVPVLALFYIASQVTIEQYAIIMGVFALSTLLLEIPSGVIADFLGKKNTLIVSRLCYVAEIAILAFANGFWPFLVAKIISGVGVSLNSGTSESLLYDSVKKLGKEKDFKRVKGKQFAITNVSMAVTFILGGILFSIDTKIPAIISLIPMSLAFILTFFFKEPYPSQHKLRWDSTVLHLKTSVKHIWSKTDLKFLIAFGALLGLAVNYHYTMFALTMEAMFIPVTLMGLAMFITSILTAWVGKQTHKLTWSFSQSLHAPLIIAGITFLVLSALTPLLGFLVFLFIPIASGFYSVWSSDEVNKRIPSSHRATMISVQNFFMNIAIFAFLPFLGSLAQNFSLGLAHFSLALIFVIGFLILSALASKKVFVEKA